MVIETLYNKKFDSHFIYEMIKEPGDDGDRFVTSSKLIWSKTSPEWEKYNDLVKRGKKRRRSYMKSDMPSMEWDCDNLQDAKLCYIMFIFEDIKW